MKRRTNKGFSLIELLIVVAIILLIAAIAVPSLLRARIAANETSAAVQKSRLPVRFGEIGVAPATKELFSPVPPSMPVART